MPTAEESEDQLETAASDTSEPPSSLASLAQGAQRVVRTLWHLARTFLELEDLFDERPRGGLFARTLAKLPSSAPPAGGSTNAEPSVRQPDEPTD